MSFQVSGWSGGAERVSEVSYSGPLAVGDIVCQISGTVWVQATGANLTANNTFPAAIVLEVSSATRAVVQSSGTAISAITGLATFATSELVRLNTATARIERLTAAPLNSDWLLGRAFPTGSVLLTFSGVQGIPSRGSGVAVIVDIRSYGAACDGSDDIDAFELAIADAIPLGIRRIQVPKTVGGTAVSRRIDVLSSDPDNLLSGLVIEGEYDTLSCAPAVTWIVWLGAKRHGTAASLVATADDVGSVDPINGFTWTTYTLSNCVGAGFSARDVGVTKIRIEGASSAYKNCQPLITEVIDDETCTVAIPNAGALTDPNNGSLEWTVLDSCFNIAGRAIELRNISVLLPTGKYLYNAVSITHPYGPGNQLSVSRCGVYGMSTQEAGTGVLENGVEIGGWILPTKAGFTYTISESVNSHYRPWSPYQLDYLEIDDVSMVGAGVTFRGAAVYSANASGQSRANIGSNVGVVNKEAHKLDRSDFPAQVGVASCQFEMPRMSGGVVTGALVENTSDQAQTIVRNIQVELAASLYKSHNTGAGPVCTLFDAGYVTFTTTGAAAVNPVGLFQTRTDCLNVENLNLHMSGLSLEGYFATLSSTAHGTINFRGCILPHWSTLGKASLREMFDFTGALDTVNITGCMVWSNVDNRAHPLADCTIVGSAAAATADTDDDTFGKAVLVRGLSSSLVNASNFCELITISGTNSTAVWPFRWPEEDEDFDGHYYEVTCSFVSSTGSPAPGSTVATCSRKSRMGAVIQCGAAPGGGASVTMLCTLIRHSRPAVTAWHPLLLPSLTHWFDASRDWNHHVPISRRLADPGQQTPGLAVGAWRSQAVPRKSSGNRSIYDLLPKDNNETRRPATRAKNAGYNNRYTLTSDATDMLSTQSIAGAPLAGAPCTYAFVGHPGGGASEKACMSKYLTTGGGADSVTLKANGTSSVDFTVIDYGGSASTISVAHNWSGKEVVIAVADGANSRIYISSKTAGVVGPLSALAGNNDGYLMLLNDIFEGKSWAGNSSGITNAALFFNAALTNTECGLLADWLGADVGKTITP